MKKKSIDDLQRKRERERVIFSGILKMKAFLKIDYNLSFYDSLTSAKNVQNPSWDAATITKGKAIEN